LTEAILFQASFAFLSASRCFVMAGGEEPFPALSPESVKELTDDQVDKQNALKSEAVDLLEDGKTKEALAKFSEAIAVGCASALLYSRRAGILMKLGRPHACINDCTAALKENPDSAKALKMRARAKAKLELWEEANFDFQQGLKIDFDDETEEESKIAAEKAKSLKSAAVNERVQKEEQERQKKLVADKAAYVAAMKAREEEWTDAKEAKYQETCRKAETEKKRKEAKEAERKETPETKAAAKEASEAADKEAAAKAAAEKAAAEARLGKEAEKPEAVASGRFAPATRAKTPYPADAPEAKTETNNSKAEETD